MRGAVAIPGAYGLAAKREGESRMMGNYQVRFGGRRGVFQQWTPPRPPYAKEWRMPSREWAMAKARFAILFEDGFRLA
jgi:hypothetical protein